ncbi:hypothetical protein SOVF_115960 [Spinacia oleracea]|uniref:Protein PARTING DANCERS n=1 Tax=Spinacia oleracea TaxID=3562 RepID=A0A9R0IXE9_SPIOL|nr:protein PARTING DANCERS [Spinacia oleracea]KNA13320.1 hypothetical protein SOVF_115960 [Spinacia oleracea]
MADSGRSYGAQAPRTSSEHSHQTGSSGVCLMNIKWKEEQHPSFINFISTFLSANSFKLNIVPIDPDFIFNCGGVSVAIVFVTSWDPNRASQMYSRVHKLKEQFAYLYVVVTIPTEELNESFIDSYFASGIDIGRPTFISVLDMEMGFEKIVKIVHVRGVCKKQDVVARMKAERIKAVQGMDAFLRVVTSIPGIDNHDANSLNQAIGSIEAIANASKEYILENTDLSAEKAETIWRFFRDPKYYLSPRIN